MDIGANRGTGLGRGRPFGRQDLAVGGMVGGGRRPRAVLHDGCLVAGFRLKGLTSAGSAFKNKHLPGV